MKNSILIFILGISLSSTAHAQHLYPFHDYYHGYGAPGDHTGVPDHNRWYIIDLDNFSIAATISAGSQDFKVHSKYARRFTEYFLYPIDSIDVYGEDLKTVIGHIEVDRYKNSEKIQIGPISWTIKLRNAFIHCCATLVVGDIIVISDFCKIDCSASLSAYNMKSGKLIWDADVVRKPFGHDKYSNKVILSLYKNKVIMEGIETDISYVQIFDLYTGMRIFSTIQ